MASEAKAKINKVDGHHTLYLSKYWVEDSAFPFKSGEDLLVKIDGRRLVIERKNEDKKDNKVR